MLDTHVHFYDPNWPGGIQWPSPSKSYYGPRLPQDYTDFQGKGGVTEVIAIETSPLARDDQHLQNLARTSNLIAGYVANLQPAEKGFARRLTQFRQDPKFKGIRLRPIEKIDLKDPLLIEALDALSDTNLTLELGAKTTARLHDIATLATNLPGVKLVLTHGGHPAIGNPGPRVNWTRAMEAIGQRSNTYLKITPLLPFVNGSKDRHLDGDHLRDLCAPYFQVYAASFGSDRLILGSNWPVSEQLGSFQSHTKMALQVMQDQLRSDPLKSDLVGRRLYDLNGPGGSSN
ncbi:MAG: amidohydrolase family protein [Henriciella sp.]